MFYSEAILARRGPLAKVWIAAHMERKLSKTQTLQTNIEESVGAIMGQEVEIMALRLSGQLLLGVVRIYSRKARYLLDDCNEALLKIKMAFRPGVVDMTEDQLAVNRNAITLQENNIDLDLLLPDMNWDMDFEERAANPQNQNQHVARITDITLATGEDLHLNLGEPEFDFDLGLGDGIGSQDYELDLGIDFGDGPAANEGDKTKDTADGEGDETMSVEIGRDAMSHRSARESIGSHLLGKDNLDFDALSNRSKSRELSEHPMDIDFGADFGGMDIDLGLDFGETGDMTMEAALGAGENPTEARQQEQEQPPRSPSRASSRLTTPPPSPPPEDPNATPRAAEGEMEKKTRRVLQKKQIIDSVTELADGPGLNIMRGRNGDVGNQTKDVSEILQKQQFLPRSKCVMRLLEIRKDPLAHFVPTKVTPAGAFFCAGPPGLAPELEEMFMRPITNIMHAKRRGASPEKGGNKRARLDDENRTVDDIEVERVRRAASLAPSDVLRRDSIAPPDISGGFDFGDDTGMNTMDDYQFDLGGEADIALKGAEERARSKSRLSTPAAEGELVDDTVETYADASCPIAFFDERQQSQTQTQSGENVSAPPEPDARGYSKNTVKALTFIRRELAPTPAASTSTAPQEKAISFNQVSAGATRRAASSFFFELLVLGTRDCVKLQQPEPFENIEVHAKEKLWERQRHVPVSTGGATPRTGQSQSQPYTNYSRASSVAASIA